MHMFTISLTFLYNRRHEPYINPNCTLQQKKTNRNKKLKKKQQENSHLNDVSVVEFVLERYYFAHEPERAELEKGVPGLY